ncbi:MAG: hypothetical protein O4751_16250 [Trichodesmium sp. St2_bin6]|nr:hypothetical protein [Trichodesmium sp. St2_bin6]
MTWLLLNSVFDSAIKKSISTFNIQQSNTKGNMEINVAILYDLAKNKRLERRRQESEGMINRS